MDIVRFNASFLFFFYFFSLFLTLYFFLPLVAASVEIDHSVVEIADIDIKGNKFLSDDKIRSEMLTKPPSIKPWVKRPKFDEIQLRNDLIRIRELYDSYGYYDAQVRYELQYDESKKRVKIIIYVEEGEPVVLRNLDIRIKGEKIEELKKLEGDIRRIIPLKEGEVFSSIKFKESKKRILEYLSNLGYPKAVLESQARVNIEEKWADAFFKINLGTLYTFGEIYIRGLKEISEKVVRREITFEKGETFSTSKVVDTRNNIFETGLFKSVNIDTHFDQDKGTVDVTINLVERKLSTIRVGVGFGTEDLLRGQLSWTKRNFLGEGRLLNVTGKFSSIVQRTQVLVKQPYFLDTAFDLTSFLDFARYDLPGYKGKSVNANSKMSRKINKLLTINASSDLMFARIDSQAVLSPIEKSKENVFLVNFSLGLDYVNVDNIVNPTNGIMCFVFLETSPTVLGSEADYVKSVLEFRAYRKVSSIVIAKRLKIGVIDTFGETEDFDVPIFERFFAGGSASMRGFPFRKLGPLDAREDPLGGNSVFIGNLESRFPVYKKLGGVAFIDFGNVFSKSYDFEFDALKYAVGVGIRYNTIIGPLRLDLGYTLSPDEDLSRYQVFFSIGQAF